MKEGIHPDYKPTTITCACGEVIETASTKENIKVTTSTIVNGNVVTKSFAFFTSSIRFFPPDESTILIGKPSILSIVFFSYANSNFSFIINVKCEVTKLNIVFVNNKSTDLISRNHLKKLKAYISI